MSYAAGWVVIITAGLYLRLAYKHRRFTLAPFLFALSIGAFVIAGGFLHPDLEPVRHVAPGTSPYGRQYVATFHPFWPIVILAAIAIVVATTRLDVRRRWLLTASTGVFVVAASAIAETAQTRIIWELVSSGGLVGGA